jgi:hypothetical protein
MPEELTPRQAEALSHIKRRIANGLPPSNSELAADLGYRSFSNVAPLLRTLARIG